MLGIPSENPLMPPYTDRPIENQALTPLEVPGTLGGSRNWILAIDPEKINA